MPYTEVCSAHMYVEAFIPSVTEVVLGGIVRYVCTYKARQSECVGNTQQAKSK